MKKIALGIGLFAAAALASLAIAISYNADCETPPALSGNIQMQAVFARCYGGPEVLTLESIPRPSPGPDELLVKVHAAAVNPLDWHFMRGEPRVMRLTAGIGAPKDPIMGVDFAGTVEAVGSQVTRFKIGDAVFGGANGSLAEYVVVRQARAVAKPENTSFEEAAALPIAAVSALQALRDHGQLKAGEKVLINGASGGVGTYAVQIAKAMGAHVTGVCSTRNVELVKSLGADRVIDYTKQNFTEEPTQYALIIDNVGNHSLSAIRAVLEPAGRHVIVGTTSREPWLGPISAWIKAAAVGPFVDQKAQVFMSSLTEEDFRALAEMMTSGKLKSVIDRRFPLEQAADAIAYLETGRARGKVVVNVVAEGVPTS